MSAVATLSNLNVPRLRPGLPDHNDLPDTDGQPVQNVLHNSQTHLLTSCLRPVVERIHPDGQFFIGQDNGIYYLDTERPLDGCKSPDWYYVPNVPPTLGGQPRRSYVMWQELQSPLLVIEYASRNGAEERDRTPRIGKMWVYERAIHASYYLIFHPGRDPRIEAYRLVAGEYQPLPSDDKGRFPVPEMGVAFGLWAGRYQGLDVAWMRAWSDDGFLVPTAEEIATAAETRADLEKRFAEAEKERAEAEKVRADTEKERAEAERQRADTEKERAEAERQRADALAAKLRALGIDPDAP